MTLIYLRIQLMEKGNSLGEFLPVFVIIPQKTSFASFGDAILQLLDVVFQKATGFLNKKMCKFLILFTSLIL